METFLVFSDYVLIRVFKIDLIVWKPIMKYKETSHSVKFKIDLIVWKR